MNRQPPPAGLSLIIRPRTIPRLVSIPRKLGSISGSIRIKSGKRPASNCALGSGTGGPMQGRSVAELTVVHLKNSSLAELWRGIRTRANGDRNGNCATVCVDGTDRIISQIGVVT